MKGLCGCKAEKSRLFINETQSMLADNELPCQKAENYSTPITVLHHGALMEAVEIIQVQVQNTSGE